MAKTIEDLEQSRRERDKVRALFGGIVPDSILKHDKTDTATDLMADEWSYAASANDGGHNGKLAEVFDVSGQSCRDGALSRFPQNIGRILLSLYTKEGDTVFDPFAGHNSRMELCWRSRRNYIGCDISCRFMEANREIKRQLEEERGGDLFGEHYSATIELHECDSRQPPENIRADFTITSPPYWDLEEYGEDPEQLGRNNTYAEFLSRLGIVALENQKRLKAGAFCVWCVNDFRKDGKFYSYHMDTARILREAGLKQHDIAILDLGAPIRAAFASQIVETKILPKRHEYAWMTAFALRSDGWYLRQDNIWNKPNPMPESVTDRCTKSHEYVFLLTKSPHYFYNQAAIKEPCREASLVRLGQDVDNQIGSDRVPGKTNGPMKPVKFGGNNRCPDTRLQSGKEWIPKACGKNSRMFQDRDPSHSSERKERSPQMARDGTNIPGHSGYTKANGEPFNGILVNKKSVWTVATLPFKEAHFATYPPALIKPCILAASGERIQHNVAVPASGTSGMVALELGRRAVLIELNPEYCALIEQRCTVTLGLALDTYNPQRL